MRWLGGTLLLPPSRSSVELATLGRSTGFVSRVVSAMRFVEADWAIASDELAYAPEASVWDRYGAFAGQAVIRGVVKWMTDDRIVLITGTRGDARFMETVR